MAGIWETLLNVLGGGTSGGLHPTGRGESNTPLVVGPASERVVIEPTHHAARRVVVTPTPRALVKKVRRPAWEEKGWATTQRDGRTVYQGFFEVVDRRENRRRRFSGVIARDSGGFAAYIADPPPEIRKHRKGPCFALTQAPWFRVHWRRAPSDVDNAILYVETVLDESLNG